MDPPPQPGEAFCPLCHSPLPWIRSVKRKVAPADAAGSVSVDEDFAVARVDAGDEAAALREAAAMAASLAEELEEERAAAASAASEAMAMILRLQREKAAAQMEVRQLRRFSEERFALDTDITAQREEELQMLSTKVEFYRHRLEALGIPVPDDEYYPRLRCSDSFDHDRGNVVNDDGECYEHNEYADAEYGELDRRIVVLEQSPRLVDDDPSKRLHFGNGSDDESVGDEGNSKSTRVYTIDAVQPSPRKSGDSGKERSIQRNVDVDKLYARLESLEAEHDSMRQALVEMSSEKAQMVLLREIAQQLAMERSAPTRLVQGPLLTLHRGHTHPKKGGDFCYPLIAKLKQSVLSLLFWKRKAMQSRPLVAASGKNDGLLLLLERSGHVGRALAVVR